MKINSTSKINFNAKVSAYPKTITDKKVFEMFEERTKDYPEFILKQEDISYFDRDYFILLKKDEQKSYSRGYFSFTNNHPKTVEGVVDRLVQIFDLLKEERLPKIVYKISFKD